MRHYPFLANVPFMRISEPKGQMFIGEPVQALLKAFAESASSGVSRTVTVWPTPLAATLLPQLAAVWHLTDQDNNPDSPQTQAERMTSLAAVIWPFAPRYERLLDGTLTYRKTIVRQNRDRRCSERCSTYHTQIIRLKDLDPVMGNHSEADAATLKENHALQNPSLADISPLFIIGGNMRDAAEKCRRRFFKRIIKNTQLSAGKIPDSLFDPARAPFIQFGLPPDTVLWRGYEDVLRARQLDIILIDIEQAERIYGERWPQELKKVLDYTRRHTNIMPPFLAISRNLYDAHLVRTQVVTERPTESLIINTSPDILSQTPHFNNRSSVPNYVITCLARFLTPLLQKGHRLAEDLSQLGSDMLAEIILGMQFFLRLMICAPAGMDSYDRFLAETGDRAYGLPKPMKLLADLKDQIRQGAAGNEEQRVSDFAASFEESLANFRETTPAGKMLRQLVLAEHEYNNNLSSFRNRKRTTLVVLPNIRTERLSLAMLEEAGYDDCDWLSVTNGEQGLDYYACRLNSFDKVYLLMPRWSQLERLFAWNATPGIIHIISDEATAFVLRKKLEYLKESRLYAQLGKRVVKLWEELDTALEGSKYDLNPVEVPQFHPSLYSYDGDGRAMTILTSDGRRIGIREGTKVVRFQVDAYPRQFIGAALARSLQPGDIVFAVDEEYADMVLRHCTIRREAPSYLRAYHSVVKGFSSSLKGDTIRDKARDLRNRMAARGVLNIPVVDTVANWLNVDPLMSEALDTVRPHAPQDKPTFDVFTDIIGIPQPIATRFWQDAIISTRSLRIRAGFSYLNFGIHLLTDPDGAMLSWDGDDEDLKQCRDYAVSRLIEVMAIEKEAAE